MSDLPPLGTRVVRGLDWQYGDQDCEGPGTIVNHANNRCKYTSIHVHGLLQSKSVNEGITRTWNIYHDSSEYIT